MIVDSSRSVDEDDSSSYAQATLISLDARLNPQQTESIMITITLTES